MGRVTYFTRRLLVLFLVPVVWLGITPEMASAASGVASVSFNIQRFGPDVSCALSMTYGNLGSDGVIKTGQGWCHISTSDGIPGTCSILQADCTQYRLDFTGCADYGGQLPDNDGSAPWPSVRITLEPATFSMGNCVPTQVCLSFHTEKLLNDQDGSACAAVDFSDGLDPGGGFEPPVDLSCLYGYPEAVAVTEVDMYEPWDPGQYFKDHIRLLMGSRDSDPADPDGLEWYIVAAHDPAGDADGSHKEGQYTDSFGSRWTGNMWEYDPRGSGLGGAHPPKGKVWGVQVTSKKIPYVPGQFGYTSMERCSFYFGPKVRTEPHPTYGDDDPWNVLPDGDLPGPVEVPDPEPVPEPVWSPGPDTDLGGFGGLLTALQAILDALVDIVNAIIDGLKDLLIPDPSSWGWNELQTQFRAKPPFSIIGELSDEARNMATELKASGSCGSLADFSTNGQDMNLTCDRVRGGGMSALYALVQAGLISITGLALFKMVSGYFSKSS